MEASLALQRAAVAKQTASSSGGGTADAFFSVPWSSPATIPIPAVVPQCTALSEEEITTLTTEAAKTQDLKPELIRAVIRRESDSFPCAISEKGAVGLMQLMPDVAAQFGVDPLDPGANVQAGSKYLKQLMTKYKGDLKLSLAAYNAGPKTVDANNKVPDIPETTAYVDAILKDLNINGAPKP